MRRNLVKTLVVVVLLQPLFVGMSFAAETGAKSTNPIFSVTLRDWYTTMNMTDYNPSFTVQGTVKEMSIPLYGATITVSPESLPQTDFLLTIFRGTGDTTGRDGPVPIAEFSLTHITKVSNKGLPEKEDINKIEGNINACKYKALYSL